MTTVSPADGTLDNSAVSRGEAARVRAHELSIRRQDLANGVPPTDETVENARLRAEESRKRALSAHRASADRHLEAGEAHRQAAAMHEQAAMLAGDGDGEFHQDAAARHRSQAVIHDAASKFDQAKADGG